MSKKIKRNHRHRTHTKRSIGKTVSRASEITLGIIIGPIKRPKEESAIRERTNERATRNADRSNVYYRADPITVASARYHVTEYPTLDVERSLMTSNAENRAYLWAHLKLRQSLATGAPIETLYVWDIASPGVHISPIAKFMLNRETNEIERT